MSKEICHVCGKEKKPYHVFLDNNVLSIMEHYQAREKGPICQRCDQYFAMTGEFKDATDEEFELARKASHFAHAMSKWWTKDKPLDVDDYDGDPREWEGTAKLKEWYRKEFAIHAVSRTQVRENFKATAGDSVFDCIIEGTEEEINAFREYKQKNETT